MPRLGRAAEQVRPFQSTSTGGGCPAANDGDRIHSWRRCARSGTGRRCRRSSRRKRRCGCSRRCRCGARPEPTTERGAGATTIASDVPAAAGRCCGLSESARGVPRRARLYREVATYQATYWILRGQVPRFPGTGPTMLRRIVILKFISALSTRARLSPHFACWRSMSAWRPSVSSLPLALTKEHTS